MERLCYIIHFGSALPPPISHSTDRLYSTVHLALPSNYLWGQIFIGGPSRPLSAVKSQPGNEGIRHPPVYFIQMRKQWNGSGRRSNVHHIRLSTRAYTQARVLHSVRSKTVKLKLKFWINRSKFVIKSCVRNLIWAQTKGLYKYSPRTE